MSQALELYIMPGCPFCRKVLSYIERRGIDIPLRDITANPNDRSTLQNVGGKVQVPLSLIHISEPTRQAEISYAVFCLKKKKQNTQPTRLGIIS